MERCTCDDSPGLESRQAWQWGVCGDNLKYSTKFLSNFLGPKRGSKDLRARADAHNTHVGIKVSEYPPYCPKCHARQGASTAGVLPSTRGCPGMNFGIPSVNLLCTLLGTGAQTPRYQYSGARLGSMPP